MIAVAPATSLAPIPAARVARAIADAAARWRDGDFPPRVRALAAIVARTGYTEPVVEYALDAAFGAIDADAILETIRLETGSADALADASSGRDDAARASAPERPFRRLRPAGRVTIVSSDTTIGVALFPLVFALAARCDVVVKDRSDDLIAAFARTLAEERPEFEDALRVERWERHDDPASHRALADSDVVVAFGGDTALHAIRAASPPEARFVGFGHRTSVAYVEREALARGADAESLADRIARDALLYDGEGCLSPHAVFVERGGATTPERLATVLALACERAVVEFPTSRAGADSVRARARAERFRLAQTTAADAARSFRGVADGWLLLVDPPAALPPPLEPCVFAVYAVDGPADAEAFLARHAMPLEAAGVTRARDVRADVLAALDALGVRRVAELGEMQRPTLGGAHGGVARVLPFLRYVSYDG